MIAEVKEVQTSFPASPPSTPKSVLPHAYRKYEVLSLFDGAAASDRADSVNRDRCIGTSLKLHLADPLVPLGQLVSHLFSSPVKCLSFCIFATFFMFFSSVISDDATVDVLLFNVLPASSSYVFVYSFASSRKLNFWFLLSSTSVVALICATC